jgi:ABC-type dipeptide/oligopeptide/nickel transport system ATPase component
VLVVSQGKVVESGEADEVFLRPQAPYTRRLVAAVPRLRTTSAAHRGDAA